MTRDPLLEVDRVVKRFPVGKCHLHAVDEVSFTIARGESVGLVGESGCGKSTLTKLVTRLTDPDCGAIRFAGADIGSSTLRAFARQPERARIQQVFQDATDSLNPRRTVADAIAEPLLLLCDMRERATRRARIEELADQVALPRLCLDRYPHQLSGGQRARVGIARALASRPSLIVLDEPTAALDVSVQAVVLKLLDRLRQDLGVSYLFVSHDLHVVKLLCSRVLVMYLGVIVEAGPSDELFANPRHPYTRALLSASPGAPAAGRVTLQGQARSPVDPSPTACRLVGRCSHETSRCSAEMPKLQPLGNGEVACHFPLPTVSSVTNRNTAEAAHAS